MPWRWLIVLSLLTSLCCTFNLYWRSSTVLVLPFLDTYVCRSWYVFFLERLHVKHYGSNRIAVDDRGLKGSLLCFMLTIVMLLCGMRAHLLLESSRSFCLSYLRLKRGVWQRAFIEKFNVNQTFPLGSRISSSDLVITASVVYRRRRWTTTSACETMRPCCILMSVNDTVMGFWIATSAGPVKKSQNIPTAAPS